MSRNLSQSTAWILAGFGSMFVFGLLFFWVMNIPRAHEREGHSFDIDARITSDAYEISADETATESPKLDSKDGSRTIRSDDPVYRDDIEAEDGLIGTDPDHHSENQRPLDSMSFAAKALPSSKKKI